MHIADGFTHHNTDGIGQHDHDLGAEPYEPPYIYAENELPLDPGMVFTVEPGIYLPGQGGARVEDDVLITSNGAESLSGMPRELTGVG